LFSGTRLAGVAIGLRGNQSPLYWDVFIAHPIDQPSNFRAGGLNAGFNLSVSF
jgi:hemolysin activation/secretion protein